MRHGYLHQRISEAFYIVISSDAMTRRKVPLCFIENDSSRKATFKKRKKGLIKKLNELTVLCGIEACAMIYSPYEAMPELWPSANGVERVISRFRAMPDTEQNKKMVNQESFLKQRITKFSEQLKKMVKDNREKEVTRVMFDCVAGKYWGEMTIVDLRDLGWVINQHLNLISKRKENLEEPVAEAENQTLAEPTMEVGNEANETMEGAKGSESWFTETKNPGQDEKEMMKFFMEDMILPFGDENHSSIWSNPFSP